MSSEPTRLKTLLGEYPVTRALKQGRVASTLVRLDIADVKVPHTAFKLCTRVRPTRVAPQKRYENS